MPAPRDTNSRPHRLIRLTSPHMKGADIRRLQSQMNLRLSRRGLPTIAVDGEWGTESEDAWVTVARALGFRHRRVTIGQQILVRRPWLRPPWMRVRERAWTRAHKNLAASSARALTLARHELAKNVYEVPAGSNWGPKVSVYLRFWRLGPAPWCGAFAGWILHHIGVNVTNRVVYCPYIVSDAHAGVNGFRRWASAPRPGFLALFDWNGDGLADHVAIVEKVTPNYIETIEGNTSPGNHGSQNNGGGVYRRQRSRAIVMGYAVPRYR